MTTYEYVINLRTGEFHVALPGDEEGRTLCGRILSDARKNQGTVIDLAVTCTTCRLAFRKRQRAEQAEQS